MPRRRQRVQYEHLTDFDRGRVVGMREAGLSYRQIATRLGRAASTIMRTWRQWSAEGRTHRQRGTGPRYHTTAREDRHLYRMAITDRTATSTTLAQQWNTVTSHSMSASSVRRRLVQRGLIARRPLLRLPLTLDNRRLRHLWGGLSGSKSSFPTSPRFNLSNNDGRIRVRHRGERNLEGCIRQRHTGPTPGVMVWGAIGYHSRTRLLRIEGNLNAHRYIEEVVRAEVVPFVQRSPGAIFQQDNARPHIARIVQRVFNEHQIQLLPWPARSPDMSPIEHVWSMLSQRLVRQAPPPASTAELWTRLEGAWQDLPQEAIQTLISSMPRRVQALVDARGGFTTY